MFNAGQRMQPSVSTAAITEVIQKLDMPASGRKLSRCLSQPHVDIDHNGFTTLYSAQKLLRGKAAIGVEQFDTDRHFHLSGRHWSRQANQC